MAIERTLSIIKPDATRRNLTGAVTQMLEEADLRVVASKRIHMTREQAEGFYAVHRERPFFGELVDFMMSEPVVVQVLEGEVPSPFDPPVGCPFVTRCPIVEDRCRTDRPKLETTEETHQVACWAVESGETVTQSAASEA